MTPLANKDSEGGSSYAQTFLAHHRRLPGSRSGWARRCSPGNQLHDHGAGWGAVPWQNDPPGLPKGAQIAVLAGDPGKPGPFVLRVRFPPGTVVAPHRHATAENLTVLSGDLYHGMGEKLTRRTATGWKPAASCSCPP